MKTLPLNLPTNCVKQSVFFEHLVSLPDILMLFLEAGPQSWSIYSKCAAILWSSRHFDTEWDPIGGIRNKGLNWFSVHFGELYFVTYSIGYYVIIKASTTYIDDVRQLFEVFRRSCNSYNKSMYLPFNGCCCFAAKTHDYNNEMKSKFKVQFFKRYCCCPEESS